jgi:phosphoglycolate phosphatase-like HAD superfamily hydrolase
LFDIDGTLIRPGLTSVLDGFRVAFRTVFGIDEVVHRIDTGGMIDRQIIREIARLHGRPCSPEQMAEAHRVIADYCRSIRLGPVVLPGVTELLAILEAQSYPKGILTGNIQEVAWLKLGEAGLATNFQFGAFGDEADERAHLVPLAVERARQTLGVDVAPEQVWIIGDTPRDIACARANGARVVAVATGRWTTDQLVEHEPDALFADLQDAEKFLAAIAAP